MNSEIDNFTCDKNNEDEEYIMPPSLFAIKTPVIVIKIPFCEKNEATSKQFHQ